MNNFPIEEQQQAAWLSASCFMNSLLREWSNWQIQALPDAIFEQTRSLQGIAIPLTEGSSCQTLWVPIQRVSPLGRHRYAWPWLLEDHQGQRVAITLEDVCQLLAQEKSIVGPCREEQRAIFLQRLQDSYQTMAESLEFRRSDIHAAMDRDLNFLEAEQLLLVGHSFHPTPKSRDEFSREDKALYTPEMAGHFPLCWLAVDPEYLIERQAEHWQGDWIQELMDSDPLLKDAQHHQKPASYRWLPMHPWQARQLQKHPALQKAIAAGKIIFREPQGSDFYPTSSLRSLYRPGAAFMLKFSMSVKLTNSIRHLTPVEVERGIQVHDVFHSQAGQELLQRCPNFQVLQEPAYAALRGDDGALLAASIVVCRENPFVNQQPEPQVLATLAQEDPEGRGSLILHHIRSYAATQGISLKQASRLWFQQFCQVGLKPLMLAQADYGILLGAHQQNMLLTLDKHLPQKLYFRDCQGTGYSEWAYERMRSEVKSFSVENGNILPSDMAIQLFTYYLIINSCFNVIAAIADSEAISEQELIGIFRQFVEGILQEQPYDSILLQNLLQNEQLMHKGNFHCSMQGINENTSSNPLAIYTPIPNPIRIKTLGEFTL